MSPVSQATGRVVLRLDRWVRAFVITSVMGGLLLTEPMLEWYLTWPLAARRGGFESLVLLVPLVLCGLVGRGVYRIAAPGILDSLIRREATRTRLSEEQLRDDLAYLADARIDRRRMARSLGTGLMWIIFGVMASVAMVMGLYFS